MMPTIEGPKVSLGFDTLLLAGAVILAFFAVLVAVVKGVEAWKKISLRDRVKGLEMRMDACEKRLRRGDKIFKQQSDDLGQVLVTMQGLLLHFITGNDHERLKETNEELTAYMAERATREMEDSNE
jgi:uncharacterized membrane protein affecting hemolysin expression